MLPQSVVNQLETTKQMAGLLLLCLQHQLLTIMVRNQKITQDFGHAPESFYANNQNRHLVVLYWVENCMKRKYEGEKSHQIQSLVVFSHHTET